MQGEWSNFIGDNCVSASIYALQDLVCKGSKKQKQ